MKKSKELAESLIELLEMNMKLQMKINKAIKYIKSYLPNYDFDHSNLEKLLEILRDKENEQ